MEVDATARREDLELVFEDEDLANVSTSAANDAAPGEDPMTLIPDAAAAADHVTASETEEGARPQETQPSREDMTPTSSPIPPPFTPFSPSRALPRIFAPGAKSAGNPFASLDAMIVKIAGQIIEAPFVVTPKTEGTVQPLAPLDAPTSVIAGPPEAPPDVTMGENAGLSGAPPPEVKTAKGAGRPGTSPEDQPIVVRGRGEMQDQEMMEVVEEEVVVDGPMMKRLAQGSWKSKLKAACEVGSRGLQGVEIGGSPQQLVAALAKLAARDPHPTLQEACVKALTAALEAGLQNCGDASALTEALCPLLASPKLRAPVMGLLEMAAEGFPADVLAALDRCGQSKAPKTVAAGLLGMRTVLERFGPRQIPVRVRTEWLAHKDKDVRKLAVEIVVEMARWLGKDAAVASLPPNVAPAQAKEVAEAAALIGPQDAKSSPARKLRDGVAPPSELAVPTKVKQPPGQQPQQAQPKKDVKRLVHLSKAVKKEFYDALAPGSTAKWIEKKDHLQALVTLVSDPQVQLQPEEEQLVELLALLKKAMVSDKNIVVRGKALEAFGAIAAAAGPWFRASARSVLGPALAAMFKEKRPQFVSEVHDALERIVSAVGKEGVLDAAVTEAVVENCKSKLASVAVQTIVFLERAAKKGGISEWKQCRPGLEKICSALCKACEHESPEVRSQSFSCLCCLRALVADDDGFLGFVTTLEPKKLERVMGYGDGDSASGEKSPDGDVLMQDVHVPVPEKQGAGHPRTGLSRSKTMEDKPTISANVAVTTSGAVKEHVQPPQPSRSMSASLAPKAPPAKRNTGLAEGGKVAAAPPAQRAEETPQCPKEEAVAKFAEVIPENVTQGLSSAQWKERLEAAGALALLLENESVPARCAWPVIVKLEATSAKESNFSVVLKLLSALSSLARRDSLTGFDSSCSLLAVESLVSPRLGDPKLSTAAKQCLTEFSDALGLACVVRHVFPKAQKEDKPKSPRWSSDAIGWLVTAVETFGLENVAVIADAVKSNLGSAVSTVRTEVVKLLGVASRLPSVGPGSVRALVAECGARKQTVDCVEKTLAETEPLPKLEVTKISRAAASGKPGATGGAGSVGVAQAQPRADLSSKVSKKLLTDLESVAWKERLEATAELQKVIKEECHGRIGPSLGKLQVPLKARLGDANKSVVRGALLCLCEIAKAMEKSAVDKSIVRPTLPSILLLMGDANKTVHDSAVECALAICENSSIAAHLPCLTGVLCSEKAELASLRKEAITLVEYSLGRLHSSPGQLTPGAESDSVKAIVKPVLVSLQDKLPEVRKVADKAVTYLVTLLGIEAVEGLGLDQLKPAFQNTLLALLVKYHTPLAPEATQTAVVPASKRPTSPKDVPSPLPVGVISTKADRLARFTQISSEAGEVARRINELSVVAGSAFKCRVELRADTDPIAVATAVNADPATSFEISDLLFEWAAARCSLSGVYGADVLVISLLHLHQSRSQAISGLEARLALICLSSCCAEGHSPVVWRNATTSLLLAYPATDALRLIFDYITACPSLPYIKMASVILEKHGADLSVSAHVSGLEKLVTLLSGSPELARESLVCLAAARAHAQDAMWVAVHADDETRKKVDAFSLGDQNASMKEPRTIGELCQRLRHLLDRREVPEAVSCVADLEQILRWPTQLSESDLRDIFKADCQAVSFALDGVTVPQICMFTGLSRTSSVLQLVVDKLVSAPMPRDKREAWLFDLFPVVARSHAVRHNPSFAEYAFFIQELQGARVSALRSFPLESVQTLFLNLGAACTPRADGFSRDPKVRDILIEFLSHLTDQKDVAERGLSQRQYLESLLPLVENVYATSLKHNEIQAQKICWAVMDKVRKIAPTVLPEITEQLAQLGRCPLLRQMLDMRKGDQDVRPTPAPQAPVLGRENTNANRPPLSIGALKQRLQDCKKANPAPSAGPKASVSVPALQQNLQRVIGMRKT